MLKNKQTRRLFKDSPYSSELNYHMENSIRFWEEATPEEAIVEVNEILSTYYEEGHVNYEGLYPDDLDVIGVPSSYIKEAKETQKERRKEVRELKKVIKHLESQFKPNAEWTNDLIEVGLHNHKIKERNS